MRVGGGTLLAEQIISKSCVFHQKLEFAPLILALGIFLRITPLCIKYLKFLPPFSKVCVRSWYDEAWLSMDGSDT